MPPEMMRIESGSGLSSAAMDLSTLLFAFPGTLNTTVEEMKGEGEISRKVFPLEAQEQEHFTILISNPRPGYYIPWTAQQEGFHRGYIQFRALHDQPVSSQEEKSAKEATGTISLSPTISETVSPEAARRFRGHERIVHEVCSLAKEEAQSRGLTLLRIDVRPAWSHEYDERTGIVIDVEIRASSDERFSYWDAVCERLNELEESVPPEERCFLNDEVSFIVNRS